MKNKMQAVKQAVISRYERFESRRKALLAKEAKSPPRCPFEGRCSSYPDRCKACVHNPEPDHFEPKDYPHYPYPYPWWKRPTPTKIWQEGWRCEK